MEKETNVLVVGRGIAGFAAAWYLASKGADVLLVAEGSGATALGSGALDWADWHTDSESATKSVTEDLRRLFSDEYWRMAQRPAMVATLQGILRPTLGHQRRVLNLDALQNGAVVGVPALIRDNWNAATLAKAWSESPWARQRNIRFEALGIGLWDVAQRHERADDTSWARLFDDRSVVMGLADRLRGPAKSWNAVITGPWLGIRSDAALELSEQLEIPVGETLAEAAGPGADRWEAFVEERLEGVGVARMRGRVARISEATDEVLVWLEQGLRIRARKVVLAAGGVLGGGLRWNAEQPDEAAVALRGPLEPSFQASVRVVVGDERFPTPGSAFGVELEQMFWPQTPRQSWALDDAVLANEGGVLLDESGKTYKNVWVAGKLALRGTVGMIRAAASGIEAAQAAWA